MLHTCSVVPFIFFLIFKTKRLNMFPFVLQIFGIYMIKDKDNVTLKDVLQPGKKMVAAGYCMYGSSCTVIRST
jgi:hypothetical protein